MVGVGKRGLSSVAAHNKLEDSLSIWSERAVVKPIVATAFPLGHARIVCVTTSHSDTDIQPHTHTH
uniref:Uncharacterized protein n=1 Tax=Anopheles quadriannulatus TaxID=34691 RepID=A0A182XRY8_ANOQN